MPEPRVHLLPAGVDLLDRAAHTLVARHRARLPDLSRLTLLLPSLNAAPALRRALARQAGRGLLGPKVLTFELFVQSAAPAVTTLPALDCRLRLASALARHRHLFPGVDSAHAADALFALFEDLIDYGVDLGDDESAFERRLRTAYRLPRPLHYLSQEAQIVHRLFTAYRQDTDNRSPAATRRQQMQVAFATLDGDPPLSLLGFDVFSPAQQAVLKPALAAAHVDLWLQGRLDGRDAASVRGLCAGLGVEPARPDCATTETSALLDAAFSAADVDAPLTLSSPGPIEIVVAASAEHEARCVDLAVREALLAGARDVAIVSADRRLARRLRALLERAGVPLYDPVGWALSTSAAAACLHEWLECLVSDFQFRPLLAFLKSAFAATGADACRTLEQTLVYERGVERDLDVLIREAQPYPHLTAVLERLRTAAKRMPAWSRTHPGEQWCQALRRALDDLELTARLQADAAGARLVRLLEELERALAQHRLMLDGDGFRDLLNRQLERETFVPDRRHSPVQLLTLEQSQNLRCDVLILAGASREHLPGAMPAEPLFNASVRTELGLPDWTTHQALALTRLRRLLEAAPRVLITYAPESTETEAVLSPWVEALEATARRAGQSLRDPRLPRLATAYEVEIAVGGATAPRFTARPAPTAVRELIPAEISATAHQALIDCPYRFFAQNLLRLRAQHAPDEDPDRSEYGLRVHRILQKFTERVTAETRRAAHRRLVEIAAEEFAPDLRAHALAQMWVAEFHASLPRLLDWLEQRPPTREVLTEQPLQRTLGAYTLVGRADRLEVRPDGTRALVDYKTGHVPDANAVDAGESVQLLHYAALDPQVTCAEFLALRESEKPVVVGPALANLRERTLQRLLASLESLQTGAALPAHGDDATCEHCDYRGLCRKGDWREG